MIAYTEKGAGLHEAIARAGHLLRQENGVFVSSNDAAVQAIIDSYTLDDAKAHKSAQVSAHAKVLRDKVIRTISAGEMASWPIKLAEAAKYAQTGQDADAPMLAAEAQARGITLAALVSKVAGNATTFAGLEATIAGIDGAHRDAIKACATFAEVAAYDFSGGWPGV
jgi:hypothetical protein